MTNKKRKMLILDENHVKQQDPASNLVQIEEATISRFSAVLDSMNNGIIIFKVENEGSMDCDYIFNDINQAALAMLKQERAWLIGRKLSDLNPNPNQSIMSPILSKVLRTGVTEDLAPNAYKHIPNDNFYEIQIRKFSRDEVIVIYSDVTEKLHYQEKFAESEGKFKYVFDYSAIGKSLTLVTGELHVNNKLCEMLGYSMDELKGKKWQEISHPDEIAKTDYEMKSLISGDKDSVNFEKRYIRKDGSIMWGEVYSSIRRDDTNKPIYFMTSIIDITNRKQIEKELKESENKYRFLFEYSGIGISYYSPEGLILSCNHKAAQIMGGKPSDFEGKSILDFIGKEQADAYLARIRKTIESENPQDYEDQFKSGDGLHWFDNTFNRIMDVGGKVIGVLVSSLDITDRKAVEENLLQQNKLFTSLLSLLPVGVFMVDSKTGKPLVANDAALRFLGRGILPDANKHNLSEVYKAHKKDSTDPYPPDEMPIILGTQGITSHIDDMVVERPDGTELLLEIFGTPVTDNQGNPWASLVTFLDITQRKNAEENLKYLSYHDFLTGLYNRRFFEEEMMRLDTERNLPITIVMGDLNGLKLINDSFGHVFGDDYIKKAAQVIKDTFRSDDIVSRIGGDEFAVLLVRTSADEAIEILARLKAKTSHESTGSFELSIAFGYSTKTKVDEKISKIMENAENHMYRQKLYDRDSMRSKSIDVILNALFEKSPRELLHSRRVSKICETFATVMKLDKNNIERIKLAGLVHDIGKIGISESILNKPNRLNDNEWELMKKHSESGWRILVSVNEFSEIAGFVLDHHERWDGSGYPKGLNGLEISLESRMIALADAYDAMTTNRPYQKSMSRDDAILEIRKYTGRQFDPQLAEIFVESVIPILK